MELTPSPAPVKLFCFVFLHFGNPIPEKFYNVFHWQSACIRRGLNLNSDHIYLQIGLMAGRHILCEAFACIVELSGHLP